MRIKNTAINSFNKFKYFNSMKSKIINLNKNDNTRRKYSFLTI